jgi:predicted RNA-binding protein with PIN domain
MALVLVDAENVRRSRWPNVGPGQLVELVRQWAELNGHDVLVVFDGRSPVEADDVVGTSDESADNWLERRSRELGAAGEEYWLVTSDRALRAAAGGRAERMVGGGAFLRELLALPGT